MANMGGVSSMLEKLPGMGQLPQTAQAQMGDGLFKQMGVIIDSMTRHERRFPDVINGSRKRRIATGSGTQIQDINRLLKQHKQMQKMMKKVTKKGGMAKMMRQVSNLKGRRQPRAAGLARLRFAVDPALHSPGVPVEYRAFRTEHLHGHHSVGPPRVEKRAVLPPHGGGPRPTDVTVAISSAWASTTRSRAARPNGCASTSRASTIGCPSARSRRSASAI